MTLIDAGPGSRGHAPHVHSVRLIIELDDGDPPTGRVGRDGDSDPGERFEGLLELLSTLDRLRADAPPGEESASASS